MKIRLPDLRAPKVQLGIGPKDAQDGTLVAAAVKMPGTPIPEGRDFNAFVLALALDDDERAVIAAGGDLYVAQVVLGQQLHPMTACVGKDAMAKVLGIEVTTPEKLLGWLADAVNATQAAAQALNEAISFRKEAETLGVVGGETHQKLVDAEVNAIVQMDNALTEMSRARLEAGKGLEAVP